MSLFKFACPVCGQHIECESWRSNTVMECPTCFQQITVPQAPATEDPKFIIAGTKVGGERPVPVAPDAGLEAPPEKNIPIGVFIVIALLICAAGAAVYLFRGKIFKSAGGSNTATAPAAYTPPPIAPLPEGATMPSEDSTNWTLNLDKATIPDTPVVGYIQGKVLIAQKMVLNADGLTLRTPQYPPEAGVTIYLRPKPISSLYGKTVVYKTNSANAPGVSLRWIDAQGVYNTREVPGYALRIEFGKQPADGHLPGKIYLCTPDDRKSWVVGTFSAEVPTP